MNPQTRTPHHLLQLFLALLISLAVDLSLSAVNGYSLRQDVLVLALLDLAGLAPVAVAVFIMMRVAQRLAGIGQALEKAPWFSIIITAWAPVGLFRFYKSHDALDLVAHAALLAAFAGLGAIAIRRRWREPDRWSMPALAILAASAIALSIAWPLPGRSMIARPGAGGGAPASPEAPNLILIVLDTLRADHLGLYGYKRETTPWLDGFGASATVFDHAIASSSYTLPTHATLFTGLHPRTHGADVAENGGGISLSQLGLQRDSAPVRPLSSQATTLAELAAEAGLQTGAVCANSAYLSRFFGLDQGFETYVDARGTEPQWRPAGLSILRRLPGVNDSWRFWRQLGANERYYLLASEVNDLALRWLEPRRDERFFLFLNYMDAHAPYLPIGRKYRTMFPLAYERQTIDEDAVANGEREILAEEIGPCIDAYDAETRYLDDHLAKLFATVEGWGLLENTIVAIIADHGESFGEHGFLTHGMSVYEPEVHVPLMLRLPGQTAGERITRTVAMADVMPTLLDALGIARPEGLQSDSLFATQRGLPVVSRLGPYERDFTEEAIYEDGWKLIAKSRVLEKDDELEGEDETDGDEETNDETQNESETDGDSEVADSETDGERDDGETDADRVEPREILSVRLYNLAEDSAETIDYATTETVRVQSMLDELDRFGAQIRPRFDTDVPEMDEATRKRLEALGYLR